jgi:4-hydroxythreonine-4-phosphate dehydrogenase
MGDPAGVGPAVAVGALARLPDVLAENRVVVLGDGRALERAAADRGLDLPLEPVAPPPWDEPPAPAEGSVAVARPAAARGRLPRPGHPTPEGGRAQIAYVDAAMDVLLARQAGALVTGPVSKIAVTRAGVPFSGHTEHLARRAGVPADGVTMLFAGPSLRVALVSTHLSLAEVPAAITGDRVVGALRRVVDALGRLFRIPRPRVVVMGLNPHAGESGLLGSEEETVLVPAIRRARRLRQCRSAEIQGPIPAETALRQTVAGRFDCALAMYHDQATVASKLLDVGRSVNVTLGLPFVRTSVDHGVAYDAAEAGTADPGSMTAALALAAVLRRASGRAVARRGGQ